jgi:eukaryotic-like serine/threonine-protein kinase
MPSPTTIDEFLDIARKSGVVDEKKLTAQLERLRTSGQFPADPVQMARELIAEGVLTRFQAEQFLQGKWRRFTIGRYKVLEKLGAGGMGSVYLCEHTLMRRRVAVKVLPSTKDSDNSSIERFEREARAVATLDHPNLVRAYDFDSDDKLHFLVMEHIDGSSLQEIVKRSGPLDPIRAAHYIRQSALGLQYAHERAGLIHRDIKPGNILVDRSGIVKVLDLGLALVLHDTDDAITKKYDENVLGTADYLSPEQAIDSHGVTICTDIYSLGATFYYCLTGKPPFGDGTVAQKLIWHQTRQPKSLREMRPDAPPALIAIVEKMMAKDPAQRYQKPQDVVDSLAPWTQTPIPPPLDTEMPFHSLAASPRSQANIDVNASSNRTASAGGSSRKPWQVPGAPSAPPPSPMPSRVIPPTEGPSSDVVRAAMGPASTPSAADRTAPLSPGSPPAPRAPAPAPAANARPPVRQPVLQPQAGQALGIQTVPSSTVTDATEENPPWETDTDTPKKRPTRTTPAIPLGKGLPFVDVTNNKKLLLILAAAGVLIVVPLLGLAVFFILSLRSGPAPKPNPQARNRAPIRVDLNRQRLQPLLVNCKDGDHFLLSGRMEETELALINRKNVTIESDSGNPIIWNFPRNAAPASRMFTVQACQSCKIRGITFDGINRAEILLVLFGDCSGTRFEQLTFQNSTRYGVLIGGSRGTAQAPVTFDNVTFTTQNKQAAVFFNIFGAGDKLLIKTNEHFDFQICNFLGTGSRFKAPKKDVVDHVTANGGNGAPFQLDIGE